jgi:hypothetical protein
MSFITAHSMMDWMKARRYWAAAHVTQSSRRYQAGILRTRRDLQTSLQLTEVMFKMAVGEELSADETYRRLSDTPLLTGPPVPYFAGRSIFNRRIEHARARLIQLFICTFTRGRVFL